MTTLYVLRHAKSSWAEEGQPDRERPLAERGRRAMTHMVAHLRDARVAPALVLCSTATRARETLAILEAGFTSPPEVRFEERLYGADATEVLELLRGLPDIGSAMVVGHNPTFQDLVLELSAKSELREQVAKKFPTGALATLVTEAPWRELGPGAARLLGFVTPKQLER